MLLLTRNIWKACKVCNLFCLDDRQKSRHFFKLGAWHTVMLIAFFHPEDPFSFSTLSSLVSPHFVPVSEGCEMIPVLQLIIKL